MLRDVYVKVYEVAELVSCRNITHFSATFNRVVGVPLWGYPGYLPARATRLPSP